MSAKKAIPITVASVDEVPARLVWTVWFAPQDIQRALPGDAIKHVLRATRTTASFVGGEPIHWACHA
jgi:hypothetical protein